MVGKQLHELGGDITKKAKKCNEALLCRRGAKGNVWRREYHFAVTIADEITPHLARDFVPLKSSAKDVIGDKEKRAGRKRNF